MSASQKPIFASRSIRNADRTSADVVSMLHVVCVQPGRNFNSSVYHVSHLD